MPTCPVCGPKCSICYTLLSIWGIVMLTLLGVFFQIHSPALFSDIPVDQETWKKNNFSMEYIHEKYEQTALNCFIAAGMYVLLFIFCFVQQRMNSRNNYEMS